MRDMIPPGDRSIRNIPIPQGHRHIPPQDLPDYQPPEPIEQKPRARRRRRPGRFILWALIIIVICIGGVAGVSMFYAGATVVVHPRTEVITTASSTIVARVSAPVGTLAFSTVTATRWATTTVPATGTKKVSRQATGVVTISSTYSASQRLISGTRLKAPDGKIYRLASSVDLPANGSAVATANAESPGESYNRGATTFTLPGFAGDPRFDKFSATARLMAGGFVGDEPAVADADLASAQARLKAELDSSVQGILAGAIPATATAIPGTLDIAYSPVAQTAATDKKTATLSQSATAVGAVVGIRDLASALAGRLVAGYKGEAVDFLDQGTLNVSVASSTKPQDEEITLMFDGNTTLVWQFDPNALTTAMLGKDKGQFQAIVESFTPAIASASASVRPFWIKNFPADAEKIKVEIDTSK
ncbi:MAG TPA: hypothetical protein VJJ20_00115 [Candidatus Paceibacterota bacterium]